jgi:hypothetical protein
MVNQIMASPRQPGVHEDKVDVLLDKLCNVREELLSIERSLERMQATKKKGGKTALEKRPAPRLDSGTSQA